MRKNLEDIAKKVAEKLIIPFAFLRFTPNMLTWTGLILTAVTAYIIIKEEYLIGGIFFLLASIFDMLDGALARKYKKATSFGAFLDSNLDRLGEGFVFFAFIVVAYKTIDFNLLILSIATLIASYMTSYARCRAETVKVKCTIGLIQRPERILLLTAALIFWGYHNEIMVFLLVLSLVTVIQRLVFVHLKINR
ncbi:CDP-alcohol phosphatidyltransferase family protein [Candidatus Margulisiibacteriota bacterium]